MQNNLRGFNKTPGQLGEAIYNSTHKPIEFKKEDKVQTYYKNNVKDINKQMAVMKKLNGTKKLGG